MSSAPQTPPPMEPQHNKTFADVLHILLHSPRKLLFFLLFVGACGIVIGAGIVALAYVMPRVLGLHPVAMRLESQEGGILLESTVGNKNVYQLVVNPQEGWQPTHISVKKGQIVEFVAQGRINIDLRGVVDATAFRQKFEEAHPELNNKDAATTPEQAYTPEQWNKLHLLHPWVGPNGNNVQDSAFPARTQYKIMPNENFGALVGALLDRETAEHIKVQNCGPPPALQFQCAFLIGDKHEMDVDGTGYLWLNINDVVDPHDPDLFYEDNLGFFQVLVTVER
ncbi:MAG TPA: hypothetical protein VI636_06940 [Candidatus Angelobacter sp.]